MFFKRNKRERERSVISLLFALVLVLSISTCAWADTTIFNTNDGTIANGESYKKNLASGVTNNGTVELNAEEDPENNIFPQIYKNNGEVTTNEGNISYNYSTVVTNTATGGHTISDNYGTVINNKGFIEFNYNLVENNILVESDIEAGYINYNEGEVTNNEAYIYCNLGTVVNNEGTIFFQYYPVRTKGDGFPTSEPLLKEHKDDEDGEYIRTHSDGTPYLLGLEDGEYSEHAKAYLNVNIPDGMELYLESGEAKIEMDEDGKLVISQIRGPVTLALRQIPAPAPEDPPVPAPADKTVSTPAPAVPATADNSNLPLWSGLFILFAAAVVLSRKKKA